MASPDIIVTTNPTAQADQAALSSRLKELEEAALAAYEAGDFDRAEDLDAEHAELVERLDAAEYEDDQAAGEVDSSGNVLEELAQLYARYLHAEHAGDALAGDLDATLEVARSVMLEAGAAPDLITDERLRAALEDAYEHRRLEYGRRAEAKARFHPNLQSVLQKFWTWQGPDEPTNHEVEHFVRHEAPALETLRQNDPDRWQKAVKLFYDAVMRGEGRERTAAIEHPPRDIGVALRSAVEALSSLKAPAARLSSALANPTRIRGDFLTDAEFPTRTAADLARLVSADSSAARDLATVAGYLEKALDVGEHPGRFERGPYPDAQNLQYVKEYLDVVDDTSKRLGQQARDVLRDLEFVDLNQAVEWYAADDPSVEAWGTDVVETARQLAERAVRAAETLEALPRQLELYFQRSRNQRPETEDFEILYHATLDAPALAREGFQQEWGEGGLGGSRSTEEEGVEGVSFTSDLHVALQIARTLREAIMVANGEAGYQDVLWWAALADVPTQRIEERVRAMTRKPKGDPATVWEAFKAYLHLAQNRYDPLVMGGIQQFAGRDPANVGVVKAYVDMDDPAISYASAMSEFRVPVRAIDSIEGVITESGRTAAAGDALAAFGDLALGESYILVRDAGAGVQTKQSEEDHPAETLVILVDRRAAQRTEVDEDGIPIEPYDEWADWLEEEDEHADPLRMPSLKDLPTEQPPARDLGFEPGDIIPEGGKENILRVLSKATPEEIDFWSNWYPIANREARKLAREHGYPLEVVAGVIAVLSPNLRWERNIAAAENALSDPSLYRDLIEERREVVEETGLPWAEQPKEVKERLNLTGVPSYPANIMKAIAIIETGDPMAGVSGPKVQAFYEAVHDPAQASRDIVLDGHAINIWLGDFASPLKAVNPSDAQKAQMREDYREAAAEYGLEPQEVQAITWAIWREMMTQPLRPRTRMNLMGQAGRSRPDPGVIDLLADLHGLTPEEVEALFLEEEEDGMSVTGQAEWGVTDDLSQSPTDIQLTVIRNLIRNFIRNLGLTGVSVSGPGQDGTVEVSKVLRGQRTARTAEADKPREDPKVTVHSDRVVETHNYEASYFLYGEGAEEEWRTPWCGNRSRNLYNNYGGPGKRRFLVMPDGPDDYTIMNGEAVPVAKRVFTVSVEDGEVGNINDCQNLYSHQEGFDTEGASRAVQVLREDVRGVEQLGDLDSSSDWEGVPLHESWADAGFSPAGARRWMRTEMMAGVDFEAEEDEEHTRRHIRELGHWKGEGFTPEEADAWWFVGLDPDEATSAKFDGWAADTLLQWAEHDLYRGITRPNIERYTAWRNAGLTAEDYAAMSDNLSLAWADEGVEEALILKQLGLTAPPHDEEDILEWLVEDPKRRVKWWLRNNPSQDLWEEVRYLDAGESPHAYLTLLRATGKTADEVAATSVGALAQELGIPPEQVGQYMSRLAQLEVYHGSMDAFSTAEPAYSGLGTHLGSLGQAYDRLNTLATHDERGYYVGWDYGDDAPYGYLYRYDIDPEKMLRMPDMEMWLPGEVYDELVARNVIPPNPALEEQARADDTAFYQWQEGPDPDEDDEFDEFEPPPVSDQAMYQYIRDELTKAGYEGIVYRNEFEGVYSPGKTSGNSYIVWAPLQAEPIEVELGLPSVEEALEKRAFSPVTRYLHEPDATPFPELALEDPSITYPVEEPWEGVWDDDVDRPDTDFRIDNPVEGVDLVRQPITDVSHEAEGGAPYADYASMHGPDPAHFDDQYPAKGHRQAAKKDPVGLGEMARWMEDPMPLAVLSGAPPHASLSNKKRGHEQLLMDLQALKVPQAHIRTLRGQWWDDDTESLRPEPSVLIRGLDFETVRQLADKYGQEAFIFKGEDGVAGMYEGYRDVDRERGVEPKVRVPWGEGGPLTGADALRIQERAPGNDPLFSGARGSTWEFTYDWDDERSVLPWTDLTSPVRAPDPEGGDAPDEAAREEPEAPAGPEPGEEPAGPGVGLGGEPGDAGAGGDEEAEEAPAAVTAQMTQGDRFALEDQLDALLTDAGYVDAVSFGGRRWVIPGAGAKSTVKLDGDRLIAGGEELDLAELDGYDALRDAWRWLEARLARLMAASYVHDVQDLAEGEEAGEPGRLPDREWAEEAFGSNDDAAPFRAVAADDEPWVCVDVDGTLLEKPTPEEWEAYEAQRELGGDGPPPFGRALPGAAEAMQELMDLGARVSLYTARFADWLDMDDEELLRLEQDLADWMEREGIPFTDIHIGSKPRADWFVDDRAVAFDGDWGDCMETLRERHQRGAASEVQRLADFETGPWAASFLDAHADVFAAHPDLWVKGGVARETLRMNAVEGFTPQEARPRDVDLVYFGPAVPEGLPRDWEVEAADGTPEAFLDEADVSWNQALLRPDTLLTTSTAIEDMRGGHLRVVETDYDGTVRGRVGLRAVLFALREGVEPPPEALDALAHASEWQLRVHVGKATQLGLEDALFDLAARAGNPAASGYESASDFLLETGPLAFADADELERTRLDEQWGDVTAAGLDLPDLDVWGPGEENATIGDEGPGMFWYDDGVPAEQLEYGQVA